MFYALWVTRNGQHQWDGPHQDMAAAQKSLERNLHNRETGSGTIARGVVPAGDRRLQRRPPRPPPLHEETPSTSS